jgi:CubicO group peptidase (beta-lactamase class C family)
MKLTRNFSLLAAATLFAASFAFAQTSPLAVVSSRANVVAGKPAIFGFVLGGTEPQRVVIRASGPALAAFGVTGTLANPRFAVYRSGLATAIAANDDWGTGADNPAALADTFASAGAFALPRGSRDAGIVLTLQPGAYTVHASGATAAESGEVLTEVYSLADTANSRLTFTSELDAYFATYRAAAKREALGVAITKGDKLIAARGYGFANAATQTPATADSVFAVASISKTITAVAALQLVEAGKLDLDADVSRYLPYKLTNPLVPGAIITARHLLTHSSGIVDDYYYTTTQAEDVYYSFGKDSPVPLATLVSTLLAPNGRNFSALSFRATAPGTAIEYSNLAVALLGVVIERIAQTSFEIYTRDKIFRPLGMTRTGWRLADFAAADVVLPLKSDGTSYGRYTFPNLPASSLLTTPNDLSVFLRAIAMGGTLQGVQILKSTTVAEMIRPQFPAVEGGDHQGLVWMDFPVGGRPVWGHTGGEIGIQTMFGFDPVTKVGAVFFMNRDFPEDADLGAIVDGVYALVDDLLNVGAHQP